MSKVTHVDMLWTAGMDSTFRLVQLSKMKDVEVQPYYVVDKIRSVYSKIPELELKLITEGKIDFYIQGQKLTH